MPNGLVELLGQVGGERSAPEPLGEGILDLASGSLRPWPPQLRARFEFAGDWAGPFGLDWFGPSRIRATPEDPGLLKQIGVRAEFWEDSPPNATTPAGYALLGADEDEYSELYAYWPDEECREPQVWLYVSNSKHCFEDFLDFLRWLVG